MEVWNERFVRFCSKDDADTSSGKNAYELQRLDGSDQSSVLIGPTDVNKHET